MLLLDDRCAPTFFYQGPRSRLLLKLKLYPNLTQKLSFDSNEGAKRCPRYTAKEHAKHYFVLYNGVSTILGTSSSA